MISFFSPPVLAQISIDSPSSRFPTHEGLVGNFVSRLIVYAIVFAGFVFLVRFLIAGFTLLTSYGEPEKIDKARFDLLYSVIGLVIVVSVFFIGQMLEVIFGVNLT